ncbi:SHOCT domain-containing protein [Desulfoscipio geothermicus]|uniref:Putative membrane protein n=1 Tax=Desulfoscipio geothermicus DSM 3669 TaxID=1121426 RepID=A0A1I6D1A0_9FIRM|nr:SHOCT domain-containing protein [Desulfoscipio geothermicus]SFQ99087.1 putative membrane protein [Desulfoscipio geothermicus DSM 3669]
MHMFYGGGLGFFGMILPMLIWLFIIIGVIVLLVRWVGGKNKLSHNYHEAGGGESALEILKKRYAAGELTTEEYIARKEEIKGY